MSEDSISFEFLSVCSPAYLPHYVDFIPQKITRCGGEQGSLMPCTRRALGVTGANWWALGWYQCFYFWRIFATW